MDLHAGPRLSDEISLKWEKRQTRFILWVVRRILQYLEQTNGSGNSETRNSERDSEDSHTLIEAARLHQGQLEIGVCELDGDGVDNDGASVRGTNNGLHFTLWVDGLAKEYDTG